MSWSISSLWSRPKRERPKIPVMEQKAIVLHEVPAAAPPNIVVANQIKSLRGELAQGLLTLSRRSEALRSELVNEALRKL